MNVAVVTVGVPGTVASQRSTAAEADAGMMASMATAMPAMMNLRICVLSFVGRADVIGGTPTKTPAANGRYARADNCGELRCGLRATTGTPARVQGAGPPCRTLPLAGA